MVYVHCLFMSTQPEDLNRCVATDYQKEYVVPV